MWGNLKTIVAQYYNYNNQETELTTTDDIDGWVFVDKSGIYRFIYFVEIFYL